MSFGSFLGKALRPVRVPQSLLSCALGVLSFEGAFAQFPEQVPPPPQIQDAMAVEQTQGPANAPRSGFSLKSMWPWKPRETAQPGTRNAVRLPTHISGETRTSGKKSVSQWMGPEVDWATLARDPSYNIDVQHLNAARGSALPKNGVRQEKEFAGSGKTARTKPFQAMEFKGEKESWFAKLNFLSKPAATRGKYEVPNLNKTIESKDADVKEARDAQKRVETREMAGNRPFLGKEYDRMKKPLDPQKLPMGASASVEPGSIEGPARSPDTGRYEVSERTLNSGLKEIKTVEDVRELLNKNR